MKSNLAKSKALKHRMIGAARNLESTRKVKTHERLEKDYG